MTEFSKVSVRGSSWRGWITLKFLGSNLERSINSPLRASLTSFAGSSWIESDVCWDVLEVAGVCEPWSLSTTRELIISGVEEGKVTAFGVGTSEDAAWDDEVVLVEEAELTKALTAAYAAAAAVFSMVSLMVAWTSDFTWVSWPSDSSLSSDSFRSTRSCTCCCSRRNSCWSAAVVGIVSPPSWSAHVAIAMTSLFSVLFSVGFPRASFRRSMSVARVPVAERVSWLHRFRRSLTYRRLRSRSAGILTRSPAATLRVRREGGII